MRARDLAIIDYPAVRPDDSALAAVQLLAKERLPGLIVVDDNHRPFTILPGTYVLKMALPGYFLSDPALARVIDEAASEVFVDQLGDKSIAQLLPDVLRELPVVDDDANPVEIAALMARSRSPLVAVVNDDHVLIGAVTLNGLLERVLAQ